MFQTGPIRETTSSAQNFRASKTLRRCVSFSGIGVHTGEKVTMNFCPAPPGTGLVFKRIDLPGHPLIPAHVDSVCDASRSTTIGRGNIRIHTVEHVLAALKAYSIDNLFIEIDSIEPPIGNGSSDVFVHMIEEAGLQEQVGEVPVVSIEQPLYYSSQGVHMVALPYEGYKISYTLSYPETKAIRSQYFSIDITPENFKSQIAPCRTFSLYEEISYLIDKGLIKGGSLDNAVVIKEDAIFSKNGLFFPDEMVRHKLLDVIGDLALVGIDFRAHIIAIKAGHASNQTFAKLLSDNLLNVISAETF